MPARVRTSRRSSTAYSGDGISKEISFDENGDVPKDKVSYWAYKNEDGTLVPDVEVSPAG